MIVRRPRRNRVRRTPCIGSGPLKLISARRSLPLRRTLCCPGTGCPRFREVRVPRLWTSWGSAAAIAVLSVITGSEAHAQQPDPVEVETPHEPPPEPRPGRYRVGPFYLTAKLHLGPVGFDSNVLYTPTDRQPDFLVQGGPSLDLVLPLGGRSRFYANGAFDYLWFARTVSQRRWNGSAYAGLATKGRTEASIEERYVQTFSRPNYQVNDRVLQTVEGTYADLSRRLFGRTRLALRGSRAYTQTEQGQDYLGTDLGEALTQYDYRAGAELSYGITVKTSLAVLGGYEWTRYPLQPVRDADFRLAAGGLKTDPTALDLWPGVGGAPMVYAHRVLRIRLGRSRGQM